MYRVGRDKSDGGVLKDLRNKLFRRGNAMMMFDEGHSVQALNGLGGIGNYSLRAGAGAGR